MLERYFLNENYNMETALSSCIFIFFGLAPFLLYTDFTPDNSMNVQAVAPSMYWCRKETGLCLKANKPMLPPCRTLSEAIPGWQISYIQLLKCISVSYLTSRSKHILFEMCLKQWGPHPSRSQSLNSHWNEPLNSSGELRQLKTLSGMV